MRERIEPVGCREGAWCLEKCGSHGHRKGLECGAGEMRTDVGVIDSARGSCCGWRRSEDR